MPRIAKKDVTAALDRVAANITDAGGRDKITSRKDLQTKLGTLRSETEKALTDRFFRFIDHRDFKTGARITQGDVARAVAYAKQHLIENYDVNKNGFSKSEIDKMSKTGQLAVALAAELKGVKIPAPPAPATDLGKAFTVAAKDTWYISESDSQPAFVEASFPASRALTGDAVMTAFNAALAQAFDEHTGDLSAYTFEVSSGAAARDFLVELATSRVPGDPGYDEMAAGFARIKRVADDNLTDVTVLRVGPRDRRDPSKLGVDQGAYQYLIVGRSGDKLAGVMFESVET